MVIEQIVKDRLSLHCTVREASVIYACLCFAKGQMLYGEDELKSLFSAFSETAGTMVKEIREIGYGK